MVYVILDKDFKKQYKRLPQNIQQRFREQLRIFKGSARNRQLNIHKLHGKKKPLLSMNVTGNYRALFLWKDKETAVFYEIGTHSQLYG